MILSTEAVVALSDLTTEHLVVLSEQAMMSMSDYIRQTPVVSLAMTDQEGGQRLVYAKDETAQPGHTFKIRGANVAVGQYALLGARSFVTSSAGNHGLGVAMAAQEYGVSAQVFVPDAAEDAKKQAIADYGAEVVEIDGDFTLCKTIGRQHAAQTGAQFIDPFADPYVMAGQGTIAFELHEQVPELTQLVLPVGGGGLCTAVASVMKALKPSVHVIGVQPRGANSFVRSMQAGYPVTSEYIDSRFGGLAVRELDPYVFALGAKVIDAALQVENDAVFRAVHQLSRLYDGKVFEAAGATGLAGSLALESDASEVIATILTGSNASSEFGAFVASLAIEKAW